MSSPVSQKSSTLISSLMFSSPNSSKDLKKSMNALKENCLRSKITKDYETLLEEIKQLQKKVEELEFENKEHRETIDYLSCEKQISEEEKKEVDEQLLKEKALREALELKYKKLSIDNNEKIKELETKLVEKTTLLEDLSAKYSKHRAIWQLNEQKSDDEIQKLDEVIDYVIRTLRDNFDVVKRCIPLSNLLEYLTSNTEPKSIDEKK